MAVDQQHETPLRPGRPQGGDITYMDMIDERDALGESKIQKMFCGVSVMVTGSTGFLGKLLIEKLLRSCPGIKKIYLLVRSKKNKTAAERLKIQLDDVLYDKLRREQPDFAEKLEIIEGDVGEIRCGISDEDARKLSAEVDVIFHGAATVNLDEILKKSVLVNVRGTREMLLLAKTCSKLKAFVYISTAYSNCPLPEIDEKFYDYSVHGEDLIDLVEALDDEILLNITTGLIGEFPNTYAYSKAAAEKVVLKHSPGLPIAMIRPSMIISTAKEPVAGWIDNIYGPTGIVLGAATGLLHALPCDKNYIADMVPGDMVVNVCIASAWKVAQDAPRNIEDAPEDDCPPPVYNYISSAQQPLTWEGFMNNVEKHKDTAPISAAVYHYIFSLYKSQLMYAFVSFFMHTIPAYIVDAILVVMGKEPMLKKVYAKIDRFTKAVSKFTMREWKFYNRNTQNLFKELCPADKELFDFDIGQLNWSEYFITYIKGGRMYLLKETMDSIPQARAKMTKLKWLHYGLCTILAAIFIAIFLGIRRLF